MQIPQNFCIHAVLIVLGFQDCQMMFFKLMCKGGSQLEGSLDDEEVAEISQWEAIIWLAILTAWISVLSEYLVDALQVIYLVIMMLSFLFTFFFFHFWCHLLSYRVFSFIVLV